MSAISRTNFFSLVFISLLYFADESKSIELNETYGDIEKELGDEPKSSKKIKQRIKKYYHLKRYGTENPHAPFEVKYSPKTIELPNEHQVPPHLIIKKNSLALDAINPFVMQHLSDEEFKNLLDPLCEIPIKLKWWDKSDHCHSGKNRKHRKIRLGLARKDHTNATATIALIMSTSAQDYLFAKILGKYPHAVMPELKGHALALLTPQTTALSLILMMDELNTQDAYNTGYIAQTAAQLTLLYVDYWAHKSGKNIHKRLYQLFVSLYQIIGQSPQNYDEKKVGILLGSVLSGSLRHLDNIVKTDEKRQWISNNTCNLIWAGTSFLSMCPMGGAQAGAIVSGIISMGVVLGAAFYSKVGVHDNHVPTIKEIQGHIQTVALDVCMKSTPEHKTKTLIMLSWINTAINLNGF